MTETTALPMVSVIIPVYNQSKALTLCLDALATQTLPDASFEIVVVDNGSDEPVDALVDRYPNARLVSEDTPGSYAARNTGVTASRGDIIAFTDADCLPDPEWLERARARLLDEPGCGLVAGKIVFTFLFPDRPSTAELYSSIGGFNQKRNITRDQFGATANLITFRTVLDDVGPFNTSLRSGGDREWSHRVLAKGYRQVYDDTVRINHPAEQSVREIVRRRARHVGGFVGIKKSRGGYTGGRLIADVLRDIRPPLRLYPLMLRSPYSRGVRHLPKTILLSFCVGWSKAIERIRVFAGGEARRS